MSALGKLTVVAFLFSLGVHPSYALTRQELCTPVGEMAAAVMTSRQAGVTMSAAMGFMVDDNAGSPIAKALVSIAYQVPVYKSEEAQRDIVIGFRNAVEARCNSMD